MTFREELARASPPKDTTVTIGTFDGVHRGHQHLLRRVIAKAAGADLLSVALTFRNHPRSVLSPESKPKYLTTPEERAALIKAQGIDLVIGLDFTLELSMLKAREFVSILSTDLKMKGLLVGPDFALGHRREGDISTLKGLGSEMGFWVETIEPVEGNEGVIKSSRVRNLVSEGEVEKASHMLGRPHSITGLVVEGERRGRLLGFPTANLSMDPDLVVPGNGIYATWAYVDGLRYQSATSIGVRPTFGAGPRTVEAFILDFDKDIYQQSLTLEFVSRLREELPFSSSDALVQQIKEDVDQAQATLSAPQKVLTGET
jgi:riboflavin kinase/FMN adenylyltransferase